MNTVLVGALLFTIIGLGTPAAFFLRRAIPLRPERPELLQNGLWFMLPFLLMPLTWLFTVILAPLCLIIVIIILCLPSAGKKGALFYVTMGELAASAFGLSLLFVLNTFFVAKH